VALEAGSRCRRSSWTDGRGERQVFLWSLGLGARAAAVLSDLKLMNSFHTLEADDFPHIAFHFFGLSIGFREFPFVSQYSAFGFQRSGPYLHFHLLHQPFHLNFVRFHFSIFVIFHFTNRGVLLKTLF
jgi:hypothetical protein